MALGGGLRGSRLFAMASLSGWRLYQVQNKSNWHVNPTRQSNDCAFCSNRRMGKPDERPLGRACLHGTDGLEYFGAPATLGTDDIAGGGLLHSSRTTLGGSDPGFLLLAHPRPVRLAARCRTPGVRRDQPSSDRPRDACMGPGRTYSLHAEKGHLRGLYLQTRGNVRRRWSVLSISVPHPELE